jgi:hypothetical protein
MYKIYFADFTDFVRTFLYLLFYNFTIFLLAYIGTFPTLKAKLEKNVSEYWKNVFL